MKLNYVWNLDSLFENKINFAIVNRQMADKATALYVLIEMQQILNSFLYADFDNA